MNITAIEQYTIDQPLEHVEKQLKSNFTALEWKIEYTEDLRTVEGDKVKIYLGVTSPFGGVSFISFVCHGGGYVPYYVKLTEIGDHETKVMVVITGTETVHGDYGNRNGKIAEQILEMCKKDCANRSFKEKITKLFK